MILPLPLVASSQVRIESTLAAFEAAGDRIPFTEMINVQRYWREWTEVVRIEPTRERRRARWTIFVAADPTPAVSRIPGARPVQIPGFRVDVLGRAAKPIRAKGRITQLQALHIACRAVSPYGFTGPFVFNGTHHKGQWLIMFRALPAAIANDRLIAIDGETGAATMWRGH